MPDVCARRASVNIVYPGHQRHVGQRFACFFVYNAGTRALHGLPNRAQLPRIAADTPNKAKLYGVRIVMPQTLLDMVRIVRAEEAGCHGSYRCFDRKAKHPTGSRARFTTAAAAGSGAVAVLLSELRRQAAPRGLRPTRQRVFLGWLLLGKGDRISRPRSSMMKSRAQPASRCPLATSTIPCTSSQRRACAPARSGWPQRPNRHKSDEHHHFLYVEE